MVTVRGSEETVEVFLRHGGAVLEVHGDVGLATAHPVRRAALDRVATGQSHLVLDLTHVGRVDPSALAVVLDTFGQLRARGGGLQVVASRPEVQAVFEDTELCQFLPVHSNVAAALTACLAMR